MPDPTRDPPRRRLRADAERNRERLLDVARAAFGAGETNVALEQIARDAGVGIGTLYRHFPTREALVAALYRQELDELCASAGELAAELSPPAALRAWMDRFRGYHSAKRELGDALRTVFRAGTFNLPEIRAELADAIQVILEAGAAEGSLREDLIGGDIVASVVGMVSATALAGGDEQLDRMLDLLVDAARPR